MASQVMANEMQEFGYLCAKFEASTAIAQKLVSFLVQTCTDNVYPTLTT